MADAATPQASALAQPQFWTLDRIADALGLGPRGVTAISRVSTDTRNVGQGSCFVALKGENFDAHDFLADAVKNGAAALVVNDAKRAAGLGVPVYEVGDTLTALGLLARFRRRVWGRPVVGVVGTNGKTSTKELLKAALGGAYHVHATIGNYNNLVGVPLTLFALPDEADIAVIEMGTNHPGEVEALRVIVEPDIVVLTSIAEEHLEGLGDLAGVLREEASGFKDVGLAVTPDAQPEVAEAARPLAKRTISAGLDGGDVHPTSWGVEPDGTSWVEYEGTRVTIPLRGVHNSRNAMLAIAVAREAGVAMQAIASGIATMPSPPMRVNFESHGRATIINDAYNSNPGSARVARTALDSPLELIVGVGGFAEALQRVGRGDARTVGGADPAAAWEAMRSRLAPDAVILLKGSRGVRLERLVPMIAEWANSLNT